MDLFTIPSSSSLRYQNATYIHKSIAAIQFSHCAVSVPQRTHDTVKCRSQRQYSGGEYVWECPTPEFYAVFSAHGAAGER